MVRSIIVAAVLCLAAVVLAAEKEENGVGIQWCSRTTYCNTGYHCCSTTTCCPNTRYCCGGGRYCCAIKNSLLTPDQTPAIKSSQK
ncbi:uncharacterized protein [Halyomorpha halys]|uniref:uncharacterized protein n=1 Tax=Halyomorpha halys TaxID=286706 RepID=UPI0006D502DC|nr:uncharacterized protein LOC106682823 isoform X1 [Halyomorpha halys]XP_024217222.1 uncharacterized protein LOC106682823 isoform X3 [Halyomorpha halys]